MYKLRRLFGRFWFLIVAAGMLLAFLTIASNNKTLDVYTGKDRGDGGRVIEQEVQTEKPFESQDYSNSEIGLTMKVPAGWTYVKKSGYDTFVHNASASSVQVQILSYYPMVNNVTAESLAESYAARGLTLTEFQRETETSYYTICQENGMNGVTDYVERVLWDRDHVAKIVFTFNDSNYEKLQTDIWGCIDSVQWVRENPVPEGFCLYYSQIGDFEFAYPFGWAAEPADGAFYASLEGTNAYMSVNVEENNTLMSNFSQVDYSNSLSSGRQNFVLTQFQADDSSVYAEATFYYGDVQMSLMHFVIANGVYHYSIAYECPTELGAEIIPLARDSLDAVRIFYELSDEEKKAAESENAAAQGRDSVFTPDGVGSQMQSEIQSKGEALSGSTGNEDVDYSDPTTAQDSENVSSFAAALVQVAEIPQDKAEAIAEKWNSLGMSRPTYAEAYKGNDEILILLVTDSSGVNYYLYMTRGGDLQEIRMNSEDGPTIGL